MSFTLGSDVFDLAGLSDPTTAIDMTITDNGGGFFQNTGIDDTNVAFAQFFNGAGASLGFSAPGTGFLLAFSSQVSGQPRGTYLATTVVPLPAAAWLFGSSIFGLIISGYRRRH